MSASVKIVLRQRELSDGTYPLALRITKHRKSSFIHLGKSIKKEDWDSLGKFVKKSHPNSAKMNTFLLDKMKEYNDIILQIEKEKKDSSSYRIKVSIKNGNEPLSFFKVANEYIEWMKAAGKLTRVSADVPRMKYFKKFLKKEDIAFQDIDAALLDRFSIYLKSFRGVNERTMMNYMVTIRTIFNRAIKRGLVERKYYPFGDHNFRIRFAPTIKIGLSEEEVKAMIDLPLELYTPIWHTRNVWLTSFYFAGIRISDVLKLKWSDIIDDRLVYAMNKNQKISSIKVPLQVKAILQYYEGGRRSQHDFIFPELKKANLKCPVDIHRKGRTAIKKFNYYLEEIAAQAKVDKKITNHIARHTFGNITGDKISPQMLQKLYRHSHIQTTMGYQGNFIHKETDEALDKVLNF